MNDTERDEQQVKPGDVLGGKFRIERVLGVGGMGVVCAATHLQLGQLVALKFMLRQGLVHPDNVARFEQEARAAVRLKSDHVAKVTDVGKLDDGAPYMVMEYLEGMDLDAVLQQHGPLPVEAAVGYLLQACEAVAEAHALGIVHRDLKPKNLFLASKLGGRAVVKVLDFGISKQMGGPEDMSLTKTTHILGSPNYMSPEQLRSSKNVDSRSDIWSLGAILYELLTGRVPFLAETVTALTAMVFTESPESLRKLRPDLPEELRSVILKCLEKSPDHRFQTVAELVLALSPFATAQHAAAAAIITSSGSLQSAAAFSTTAPPRDRPSIRTGNESTDVAWDKTQLAAGQKPPRSKAPFVAAAAVLLAIGLGVGVFMLKKSAAPDDPRPVLGATSTATDPAATSSALVGLPTAREPEVPLVSPTGGPNHPLPTVLAPATTQHAGVPAMAHPPAVKDAGVTTAPPTASSVSPVAVPPPTTTKTNDTLPTTRN